MLLYLVAIVAGILVLARSADVFVEGAAALSLRLGLSAVVVGAVVIGFGTSAPELFVSGIAAAQGSADVGVGNIIGSNIANLTLVLGIAGLVGNGIRVSAPTMRREVPLGVGATLVFAWFVHDGLTVVEGVVLLLLLVVSLVYLIRSGREVPEQPQSEDAAEGDVLTLKAASLRTGLGLLGVVVGAQALVYGASSVADQLGLSGGFVGMTVVAVGTSMPEIVTATAAASKGHSDLLVGNLLGSNLFNSLAVGGLVALLAPGPIDQANLTTVGVWAMCGASAIAVVFLASRLLVTRVEAALLVVFYVVLLPFLS